MSAVSQEESSLLTKEIRAEIEVSGSIPFARFMELALYHSEYGYYQMDASRIGREGDFITSVSVGEAFGHLLASRFSEWLGKIDEPVRIVEAGAHDGQAGAWQGRHPHCSHPKRMSEKCISEGLRNTLQNVRYTSHKNRDT